MLYESLVLIGLALGGVDVAPRPGQPPLPPRGRGVELRFKGDVDVPAGASEDFVLVVDGDARVNGVVRAVVVVNGTLRLDGGRIDELAVFRGAAELVNGAAVAGDVHLIDGNIRIDSRSSVGGRVERGYSRELLHGLALLTAVVAIGLVLATVAAGLIAAAVAPAALRRAGAALTDEPGLAGLAALIVWVGVPALAALLAATVIGIPMAIGFFVFALPLLGFLGFIVTATRLGDWLMSRVRGQPERARPYLAVIVGLALLFVVGMIPVVGGLVTMLAALAGGGAIALLAWRAATSPAPAAESSSSSLGSGPA